MRIPASLVTWIAVSAFGAGAQTPDSIAAHSPAIQDNSFLVEEAYNQDAGVVQHISTFEIQRGTNDFAASFTQEWPVGSIEHQLSYNIPFARLDSRTGVGDVGLNYRYQAVGNGDTKLAIAPRLSLILPTGDWRRSLGSGAPGFNAVIPVSRVLSRLLVTHFDVGVLMTPSARNSNGDRATTTQWSTAGSAILTASNRIQPMIEGVYSRGQSVVARGRTARNESMLISPGVRAAFNFASGLQIVPGMAFPLGAGPSRGQRTAFFYLSFEHPFNNQGRPAS
jgi:hypothetical protein